MLQYGHAVEVPTAALATLSWVAPGLTAYQKLLLNSLIHSQSGSFDAKGIDNRNGMSRSSGRRRLFHMKKVTHHLIAEVPRRQSKIGMTISSYSSSRKSEIARQPGLSLGFKNDHRRVGLSRPDSSVFERALIWLEAMWEGLTSRKV